MNWASFSVMALLAGMSALSAQDVLPDEQRTNGAATLRALDAIRAQAAAATVQLGQNKDRTLTGTVISPDGYILTQASDAEPLKPLRAFFPDGSEAEVREVRRHDRLNLLLLKVERSGLSTVRWGESFTLRAGQWLCALARQGQEMRLGVVSAKRRAIPNSGAVLGVRFGVDDADPGVIVEEIGEDSPAQKAGLIAEDVILEISGQRVTRNADLVRLIAARHPGDEVTILYSRKGREMACKVHLASQRKVRMNWEGEDFANHGTSLRTDNFPEVIQHDLPLSPADMGGAVFDLQGRAVALNVSRVDRVTNYALPVELFLPEVLRWMKEDQALK